MDGLPSSLINSGVGVDGYNIRLGGIISTPLYVLPGVVRLLVKSHSCTLHAKSTPDSITPTP